MRLTIPAVATALLAAALAATGCGASTASDAGAAVPRPGQVVQSSTSHVAVVVMENHEMSDVVGAPYTRALARRYALATRYFAVTHPSLPNYLALVGGSTFGVDSDCTSCHVSAPNLVDQLEGAGITWRAYMENMPQPCFKPSGAGDYAKKHDPFLYFDDIRYSRSRCADVVPATRLAADLRSGTLPTFLWITPNLCHDTHDCSVRTGDRYLSQLIPSLLRGLGPHGVLFLTWDEGTSDAGCCGTAHGGRVATIVAGPDVRPGARIATPATHYSTLLTVERLLGLPPLGKAGAAGTRPLDGAFAAMPHI